MTTKKILKPDHSKKTTIEVFSNFCIQNSNLTKNLLSDHYKSSGANQLQKKILSSPFLGPISDIRTC